MLETSKDLLNLTIGFSVLMVSVLLSWILFEVAKTIKGVNKTVSGVQKVVDTVDKAVDKIGDKMGNAVSLLALLAKGGQQVIEIINKKEKQTKNKKSKEK